VRHILSMDATAWFACFRCMAYKSGVVTNSHAAQLYRELWRRRLRDGGWPCSASGQVSIEATCLASLALSQCRGADLPMVGGLIDWQNRDGSWPPFAGYTDGSWVTAPAVLTLLMQNGISRSVERAAHWLIEHKGAEAHWLWRWKFKMADTQARFDPDKYGWPWLPGASKLGDPYSIRIDCIEAIRLVHSLRAGTATDSERCGDAVRSSLCGRRLECR
jgi:hypothetical protein